MRYAHICLALLLSCMLSITFEVSAFADREIVLAQGQKTLATKKTTPVRPATPPTAPTTSPPADGQITNVTTRPASGLWHTGTSVDVQWQWPGYTNRPVDVTLWSGTTQVAVIISRWTGTGLSVGWNVPYNIAPGPYKVRVQSSNNSNNFSEAVVRIQLCVLAVTSPTQADKFLAGSSTTRIAWTFTGGNPGPLKLELVPAGGASGQLIADKVPYVSGQYNWQVPGNANPGNYQIRITSMGNSVMTATSQTFTIGRSGTVNIVVAEPNNFPIDGATVTVIINGVVRSATTKGNQAAAFPLVPPGTYTFTATKSGYHQPGAPGTATATTTVTLVSGQNPIGVIKLEKFGSIQISVLDAGNNAPLDRATVTVVINGVARSLTTGASGLLLFDSLLPGTYIFTATKSGYYQPGAAGTTVILASGATQSGVIKLEKFGSVKISVLDPANNRIDEATVTVIVNGVARSLATNSNGEVLFDSLPAGTHTFTATKPGYGVPGTFKVGPAATTVTLASGTTQSGVIKLVRIVIMK